MEQISVITALAIFSLILLSTNRTILDSNSIVITGETRVAATSFSQQIIDEISALSFDETTTNGGAISTAADLTPAGILGKEGGEVTEDDVDDYDGLIRTRTSSRIGTLTAEISVSYADTLSPAQPSSSATYLKRVSIKVHNTQLMTDTLYFSHLYSHHR